MIIKNITNQTQYFGFGRKGITLAPDEEAVINLFDIHDQSTDIAQVIAYAKLYESSGLIAITEYPDILNVDGGNF